MGARGGGSASSRSGRSRCEPKLFIELRDPPDFRAAAKALIRMLRAQYLFEDTVLWFPSPLAKEQQALLRSLPSLAPGMRTAAVFKNLNSSALPSWVGLDGPFDYYSTSITGPGAGAEGAGLGSLTVVAVGRNVGCSLTVMAMCGCY